MDYWFGECTEIVDQGCCYALRFPSVLPYKILQSTRSGLVFDRKVHPRGSLVFSADEVTDFLVFGFFYGGLVGLLPLSKNVLLGPVHS